MMPAKRLELFLSSQQWINAWSPPWKHRLEELIQMTRQHLLLPHSHASCEQRARAKIGSAQITQLLQKHCWIGYDPTHYNPNLGTAIPADPRIDSGGHSPHRVSAILGHR